MYLLSIIRMEREGVEKAGVEASMGGIQEIRNQAR
jgi:hypothetical protein